MNDSAVLPIDSIKTGLELGLAGHGQIVIHAPPGAGKSTRLPLWLLQHPQLSGQKILLIQPRRLAASNVARRLAEQLGEPLGQQVGLRTRFDTVVSKKSRIEVITDGLFVRMIQTNPGLQGIGCVIFDEFHERSIQADLGLAFCVDCQGAYRDADQPLSLLVMSATLAADQLMQVFDNPLQLACEGRSFPVDVHYRPPQRSVRSRGTLSSSNPLEDQLVAVVREFLELQQGSALVFLPGMAEIRRIQRRLQALELGPRVSIAPLHGSLPPAEQAAALAPVAADYRKVVLATNVAETSLTIEGIHAVIDSGLARVPQFDANKGISQLHTRTISRASAEQRRGRAGRLGPGHCYRLWSKEQQARMTEFAQPEILTGDLAPVVLETLCWGEASMEALTLLDYPERGPLAAAQQVLGQLGALDSEGRISAAGREMAQLGLHPRLAAMCLRGREQGVPALACMLATVLSEADSLPRSEQCDLSLRLEQLLRGSPKANGRIFQLAKRLCRRLTGSSGFNLEHTEGAGELLLSAYPDRVARQRTDKSDCYLIASGQEVRLNLQDGLALQPWLLVLEASFSSRTGSSGQGSYGQGNARQGGAQIRLAVQLAQSEIVENLSALITTNTSTKWDGGKGAVVASEKQMLGAITLSQTTVLPDQQLLEQALLAVVREKKLSCLDLRGFSQWQARIEWLRGHSELPLPDISIDFLLKSLEQWLSPYLAGARNLNDLKSIAVKKILLSQFSWDVQQQIDALAPDSYRLPTGERRLIQYAGKQGPILSARIQELFGLDSTPTINRGEHSLLVELLSPARRPVQLTGDLAGFWRNTYSEVCKELKGRYPKHYWPDNPQQAKATAKTKKNMDR